jgi:hypothetical protein
MALAQKLAIATVGMTFLTGIEISSAKAATFTLDPSIIFEVVDGGSEGLFDGNGDVVFPGLFNISARGPFGETSEIAEFNITELLIPPQETITSAIFQVNSTGNPSFGGAIGNTNGRAPTSLLVQGFIGNGQVDASDFQAGAILDTVNVFQNFGPETFNFDVTSFVQSLLNNNNPFAGFNVRASDIGAINFFSEGVQGPQLIITTSTVTANVPESSFGLGTLAFGALTFISGWLKLKRNCSL